MSMKKSVPAASPDAYAGALSGWQRLAVEELRAAVLKARAGLDEVIKWGHLVYHREGPVLLIRAVFQLRSSAVNALSTDAVSGRTPRHR
jgi:hypothetical protein